MSPAAEVANKAMDMVINLEQSHDLAKESVISLAAKLQAAEARALAAETRLLAIRKTHDNFGRCGDANDYRMQMVDALPLNPDLTAARELIEKAEEADTLRTRLRESEALVERLQAFVDEIKGIADISEGIAGFQLNGELLNWQQVDCMVGVEDLLALTPADALAEYRGEVLEEVAKLADTEEQEARKRSIDQRGGNNPDGASRWTSRSVALVSFAAKIRAMKAPDKGNPQWNS